MVAMPGSIQLSAPFPPNLGQTNVVGNNYTGNQPLEISWALLL